jgi:hypothetical protein
MVSMYVFGDSGGCYATKVTIGLESGYNQLWEVAVGREAGLVILDGELGVTATVVGGRVVYRR